MNTSLTAYTHLESLLLFQSLHAYGVGPQVFSRISELLKNNPHITSDKRFQSGRLSPDALRNFYLQILKEEVKSEQGATDGELQNGDVKNSRKRKAPSPSLPTVQESVQHQHLIPKLVNKLYARYRAALTNQIRHDEETYERLQSELQGIERGEWDHQLQERASRSPSVSRKSPLPAQKPLHPHSALQHAVQDGNPVGPALNHTPTPDGLQHPQPGIEPPKLLLPAQNGPAQVERGPKNAAHISPRKKQPAAARRGTSSTSLPPIAPDPPSQPMLLPQPPAPPSRGQAQQGIDAPSPFAQRSPYPPPGPPPQAAPNQNIPPPGSPQPPPSHSQADSPPPGAHLQPPPIQPHVANGVQQYNGPPSAAPQYSPTQQRFPPLPPPPSLSPSVQTPQQQRHVIPFPTHPAYPQQHTHVTQPPPPPQSGFMLPPFQVSPQDPSRAHQQPTPPLPYPQLSTPVSTRQPAQQAKITPIVASSRVPGFAPMHPSVAQARHSFSTPPGNRTPQSAASTPRSAKTLWKASAMQSGTPPVPRPAVSPIDDIMAPHIVQGILPKAKAPRNLRAKNKTKGKEPGKQSAVQQEPEPELPTEQPAEDPAPEMEARQGRARRKAPAKRARPGSIASSRAGTSIRGRSRSPSILSHTETIAADSESQIGSRVKSERGNSIDTIEEDVVATPSHMATRRRGGPIPPLQPSKKRKRPVRETSVDESEGPPSTPGPTRTVIAPRHFSRMCIPLMNDIGSHKHASTFTTAVKAKDAEGYYDIIKRPTDLKSISKAIAAGAKQVAAAASDTPVGSPGGGGGVVELPFTLDNIPPKAIVNSSQLEKELMRMFVNAVMFNAGEEGIVQDARQMFDTVQQSVSSWRSVERSSGRLEVEETPPVNEEDGPGTSKRRKL